jgi:hypothetical protein
VIRVTRAEAGQERLEHMLTTNIPGFRLPAFPFSILAIQSLNVDTIKHRLQPHCTLPLLRRKQISNQLPVHLISMGGMTSSPYLLASPLTQLANAPLAPTDSPLEKLKAFFSRKKKTTEPAATKTETPAATETTSTDGAPSTSDPTVPPAGKASCSFSLLRLWLTFPLQELHQWKLLETIELSRHYARLPKLHYDFQDLNKGIGGPQRFSFTMAAVLSSEVLIFACPYCIPGTARYPLQRAPRYPSCYCCS